jgi:hypothetical protein
MVKARVIRMVGYWYDPFGSPDLMHPRLFADPTWQVDARPQIVEYLRSGTRWNRYLGYSYCRFEGGPPPEEMGSADLCDGFWLWPEGLHVYVVRYDVRLPDELVAHMRAQQFQMPEGLSKESVGDFSIDLSFWKEWCARASRGRES